MTGPNVVVVFLFHSLWTLRQFTTFTLLFQSEVSVLVSPGLVALASRLHFNGSGTHAQNSTSQPGHLLEKMSEDLDIHLGAQVSNERFVWFGLSHFVSRISLG